MSVFLITFCLFFFEALLHFNIGKGTLFSLPSMGELFKISGVLAVFSWLNSVLISKYSDDKEKFMK